MSLVLLSLAALYCGAVPPEPTIQCGSEPGPSPEWMVRHTLTPGDLRDLRVEPIKSSVDLEDSSILMNISWILRADASIRLLKATKICVMGKSHFESYSCIRCNYTQAFQTQTRPSGGKWMFSYIGFPVELNTVYFIGAHNIPNANMNEDGPSMAVNFTSPGCLDPIMKYKKKCIEAGSLWKPNITACKKSENTVEVNFTTSPLGDRYMALIQNTTVIGTSYVSEKELTRTSMVVHVTGESEGAVVQLTPYFRTCGNDCIRQRGTVGRCPQTGVSSPQDHDKTVLGGWLPLLLSALLVATWVLVAGIYLIWRHVCYVTEFLQNRCRSEVILEKWQKKKIAEMGPVQWLTTQKQAADKVIFLLSNDNTMCDGTCDKNEGSPCANSQDLFHLAFNLFCSDLRSQAHLRKYVVVSFREGDIKDDYSALRACPAYRLTQDAADLCAELLHAKRRVSVGRRPRACHCSCLSL
ncbi:interleukin-17 receptor B isoform X3 [Cervus canadensis]|uniref:interleukin-17 receptor B isoform X3 n=1 Tax=Cervus canadensis TaxID=1574408 RepID=UPI001CA32266|nr:interleukin-17 receptor B isoform X3 [Cervus canadensis]